MKLGKISRPAGVKLSTSEDLRRFLVKNSIGITIGVGADTLVRANSSLSEYSAACLNEMYVTPTILEIREACLAHELQSNLDLFVLLAATLTVAELESEESYDKDFKGLVTLIPTTNSAAPEALGIIRKIAGKIYTYIVDFSDFPLKESGELPGIWKVFGFIKS